MAKEMTEMIRETTEWVKETTEISGKYESV